MVSFGSVLSGMIAVIFLSIYGYFFITHIKHPVYRDMRFLVLLLLAAGFRMFLPFNLPINVTIPSSELLVPVSDIVFIYVIDDKVYLYHIVFLIAVIISAIILAAKNKRYQNFKHDANWLAYHDGKLDKLLLGRPLNHYPSKIKALYTSARTSPFVFGITQPTIVIPDNAYDNEEITQILDHELTHINQHDLVLKAAFNFLSGVFWWNPFMWLIQKQADKAIELSNDISLYNRMTEQEKIDYASLLVKTAGLTANVDALHSLNLSTHSDPLLKQRVEELLNGSQSGHTMLPVHVCVMLIIIIISFIVTAEPYEIYREHIGISYDLEEDKGATDSNTYIIDSEDHYELYVDGELIAKMKTIPDEFKDYPVYKEKPDGGDGKGNDE